MSVFTTVLLLIALTVDVCAVALLIALVGDRLGLRPPRWAAVTFDSLAAVFATTWAWIAHTVGVGRDRLRRRRRVR